MFHTNLHLKGDFKIEVYDSGNNLLTTIEHPNSITNTGIRYLQTLSFADCFRYISLGSSYQPISYTSTGLTLPISDFQYIGPNNGGYINSACGYKETCSGINLSKGWRIPANNNQFFSHQYTLNEIMLTPGCTGSTPCSNEYSSFLNLYPNICNYTKAFSRLVLPTSLVLNQNNYLVIYYNLNISVNTGVNYLNVPITHDTQAGDSNNWINGLTGYYTIIHHGLKLVNPGNINFYNFIQPFNPSESICDSIIGPMGSPLEPSNSNPSQIFLYLSTDNTQFLVNSFSGGAMNTGQYFPYTNTGYAFPSGTEYFQCNPTNLYYQNENSVPYFLTNIRQSSSNNIFPCSYDYTQNCNDTSIEFLSSPSVGTVASFSYSYSSDGRTGYKSIIFEFPQTVGTLNPVKSMVLASLANNNYFYPFMDFIFEGNNGYYINKYPSMDTGNYYYNDNGTYNYLDGNNVLNLSFVQSWTAS